MKIASITTELNKARVHASYSDETIVTNLEIENLPIPEQRQGMEAVLYINLETNDLYYEYLEIPLSPSEALLKKENLELKSSLADLWEVVLMGGM